MLPLGPCRSCRGFNLSDQVLPCGGRRVSHDVAHPPLLLVESDRVVPDPHVPSLIEPFGTEPHPPLLLLLTFLTDRLSVLLSLVMVLFWVDVSVFVKNANHFILCKVLFYILALSY